jgi:hypothetical protein
MLILISFVSSCKKEEIIPKNDINELPIQNLGRMKPDSILTWNDVIFSKPLMYETTISQYNGEWLRRLIRFTPGENMEVYKYLLIENKLNDSTEWSSMFLVAGEPVAVDLDLFSFEIIQDRVVSYRLFQEDPVGNAFGEELIAGVSINDTMHAMDKGVFVSILVPPCTGIPELECFDSYIIWYGAESGTIYDWEYDPICYEVGCDNPPGGGTGGTPIEGCQLDCDYAQELVDNLSGTLISTINQGSDLIDIDNQTQEETKINNDIVWEFYKVNYFAGFSEQWAAYFQSVAKRPNSIALWKFTSFSNFGYGAISGEAPPCMQTNLTANIAPAVISPNGLSAYVTLSGSVSATIHCLYGVKTKNLYLPLRTATFVAN